MLYTWTDFQMQDGVKRHKPASDAYKALKARQKASREARAKIKEAAEKGHKLCTACNEEKSLSNFNVDKKTLTGYSTWCKSCKKEYNKKYLRGSTTLKGYQDDEAIG